MLRQLMAFGLIFAAHHSASFGAAPKPPEGEWLTEYQIVDVGNATVKDPRKLDMLRRWIGHRYGNSSCLAGADPIAILGSPYVRVPENHVFTFDNYGAFHLTAHYRMGFAIPGYGTEMIVGVLVGDTLNGIADIDLDWEGSTTHVRSVLTARRVGPCK